MFEQFSFVRSGTETVLFLFIGAVLLVSPATAQQTGAKLYTRAAAELHGFERGSTSMADVNGDGTQDLLIVGWDGDSEVAKLYLGNGDGTFFESEANLNGVVRSSSSIADVDEDGNPDLLITGEDPDKGFGTSTTTLYLGNGDGTFTEADAGLTGVDGGSTSIADVDEDGNLDLLIVGNPPGEDNYSATLYLGDGEGSFSEAGASLTPVTGASTSIADVNGDGVQDLLINGNSQEGLITTLYLGNGDGTFSVANTELTGTESGDVSIADVNGDDNPDLLIVGDRGIEEPSSTLYLGNGDGTFSEAGADLTGVIRGSASIADADGDGNPDLFIVGNATDNFENPQPTASLFLGNGDGTFSVANAGLTGVAGEGPSASATIADLYGDGDPDLLVTGKGSVFGKPSTRIYINRTAQAGPNRSPRFARTFDYPSALAAGLRFTRTVEAGDSNGDLISIAAPNNPNVSVVDAGNGIAEVTFAPDRSQGGSDVDIRIEASDSEGATVAFSREIRVPPEVATLPANLVNVRDGSTSMADVNGDGNPDLLVTGNAGSVEAPDPTATLYLGNGDGTFSVGATLTGVWKGSSSIADVNEDGHPDLLITGNAGFSGFPDPTATLYLGSEDGSFTEADASITGVRESSTSIADVDNDGHLDLLITGNANEEDDPFNDPIATLYLGNGDGTFSEANAGIFGVRSGSTSFGDVNEDGQLDLLVTGINTAELYIGNGDGTFSDTDGRVNEDQGGSTSIADVNGDNHPDLLIGGGIAPTLYLGNGDGTFSTAEADLTRAFDGSASIADVSGDGIPDLLITGNAGTAGTPNPTTTLYLGNGDATFSTADLGLAGIHFSTTSLGDIDGDQDPDLLATGLTSTTRSLSTTLYENLFNNPLPVELVGFEAAVKDEMVRLTWQTASETNNSGFDVQRRHSGEEGAWTTVGFVESRASAGTTSETQRYRFTDEDLPYEADALTYRLRQVDTDGSAHFSKTVTVERGVDEVELLGTYPNPAHGQATVRYALPKEQDVTIRLYDMLGRQVRTVVQAEKEGRQEQQLDTSGLPSGVYFLRLEAEGQTRTQKLTVVR